MRSVNQGESAMDSRIPNVTRPDVVVIESAPRPTPKPARVAFKEVLAAGAASLVQGAEIALRDTDTGHRFSGYSLRTERQSSGQQRGTQTLRHGSSSSLPVSPCRP